MAYKKPVLTEILVEAHLRSASLEQSAFFEIVPALKSLGFTDVELSEAGYTIEIDPSDDEPKPRAKPRVRCWRPDRQALIQVSEDLVVTNLTGPYPGWDHFRQLFQMAGEAVERSLSSVAYESLRLIAIDKFEVPRDGFTLGKYLQAGGKFIPHWYADADEPLDITLGRGFLQQQGKNRIIKIKVRTQDAVATVLMQSYFHNRLSPDADVLAVLEELHDESTSTFEALITDTLRIDVMGGVK